MKAIPSLICTAIVSTMLATTANAANNDVVTAKGTMLDVYPQNKMLTFKSSDFSTDDCSTDVLTLVIDPETHEGLLGFQMKFEEYATNTSYQNYIDTAFEEGWKVYFDDVTCATNDNATYFANSVVVQYPVGQSWRNGTTIYEDDNIKVRLTRKHLKIDDLNTGERIWTYDFSHYSLINTPDSKLKFDSDGNMMLKVKSRPVGSWTTIWETGTSDSNSTLSFDACGMQIKSSNGTVLWENDFDSDYSMTCDR